jgi:hypothetical protein
LLTSFSVDSNNKTAPLNRERRMWEASPLTSVYHAVRPEVVSRAKWMILMAQLNLNFAELAIGLPI